ncbi:alpha-D-ribose 1-methylphosphonate 5-triphosphate diphosphatase [Marinibacterium sp. SX1]|uniref:alpha-D-ribose 1-methylphosphonate 5-triphosphate diphosphatase n=1 Tax=Marinibacterium sp. SX1 TaxID=3388424 RepID=UPI003D18215A
MIFKGVTLILEHGIETGDLRIEAGRIVEIGTGLVGESHPGATGLVLAPALIDVHGDAFERQVMPRPNVFFPLEAALIDTDRQLAANGIATAYHALTLGWEPGLRDVNRGLSMIRALKALAPQLLVENRIQLRWETFAFDALPVMQEALAGPLTPAIAFNDHTSMSMRPHDMAIQDRAFEHSPAFESAALDDPRLRARCAKHAQRSGLSQEAYVDLLSRIWDRRENVPDMIGRVAAMGRDGGAAMLSHDDTRAETRAWYRAHGVSVSEFPMTREAAEAARMGGDLIVFGAPNAVRGGSHIGSLGAGDMVEDGLCDVLASDYFYPAMLAGVARMEDERRAARHKLWQLVSAGPARAMGLADRGRLAVELRADLVLLDWPEGGAPRVRETWVAGRPAYRAVPHGG